MPHLPDNPHEHRVEMDRRRAHERAFGPYTGDACDTCGNFTLRRAGTCLLCDVCGSTTGCS